MEIERDSAYIQLNREELCDMICKAFPNCRQLDEWKILSGGAINTLYQFKVEGKTYVLRIYARDRALCKIEKMVHQFIENQVLTPKLIYGDESYKPFAYSIFEYVSGIPIYTLPKEDKESLSYELGRTLATIHQFKLPEAGLFGEEMSINRVFAKDSSPYFEETVRVLTHGKYVRERLGDKLVQDILTFIEENKNLFPKIEENISLVHSDFKPVNLLYKEAKIFVLDWEFAHAGVGIIDFAILLRHRDQFPCDIDALATGYKDFGGTLPKNWFLSALITDFINIVTLMESPSERPKLFHQLKSAILRTMNHLETL